MNKSVKEENKPLYMRTKYKLLNLLEQMDHTDPIPSERRLCEDLDVSRPTVRKALQILEEEGKIYRLPGKGAFVANISKKFVDNELDSFIGFYEDVEMQKRTSKTKVLRQSIGESTNKISEKLGIKEGDKIFVLERLRFIDREPICIVTSFIPLDLCPEVIKCDFTDNSLYKTLENQGILMEKAIRSIETKQANNNEATLLNIKQKDPILLFESVGFQKNGLPFEYVKSRYIGANVKFITEVFKEEK